MEFECPLCGDIETTRTDYPKRFDLPDPLVIECRECQ
jgi:rRNA maturation protein Nop10